MGQDDQSTISGVSGLATEGKAKEESRRSWSSWKKFFNRMGRTIFSSLRILGARTKDLSLHLFASEDGVRPIDDIKSAFGHIPFRKRWAGYMVGGLFLTVYLLSGVYTVAPGEEAVARLFGKEVQEQITEGLHYYLPWPFGVIEKVNVMEIRRLDIGMTIKEEPTLFPKKRSSPPPAPAGEEGGHGMHGAHSEKVEQPSPAPASSKNQFLTGDENILEIKMNVQYRIKDAAAYLFNANLPDSFVPYVIRAAVTEIFGEMQVDDLLTVAKSRIQKLIAQKAQNMLDEYRTGLSVLNVNFQEVNPPQEVAQAFRDVASAKEEREEKINKAQGYSNAVVPEARGKAQKAISDGEGYKVEVVNLARGDAERFLAMFREYQKAKKITEYRLYLETMERVLSKANKFVVDSKKERVNLKFVK
jgi:membrane protease subunit HflK